MKHPSKRPLRVKVSNGVLTIEIGTATLATAALASPIAWEMLGRPTPPHRPDERFLISAAGGFAKEVSDALIDELGEDGSTLITNALDEAFRAVIENGSEYFVDSEDKP